MSLHGCAKPLLRPLCLTVPPCSQQIMKSVLHAAQVTMCSLHHAICSQDVCSAMHVMRPAAFLPHKLHIKIGMLLYSMLCDNEMQQPSHFYCTSACRNFVSAHCVACSTPGVLQYSLLQLCHTAGSANLLPSAHMICCRYHDGVDSLGRPVVVVDVDAVSSAVPVRKAAMHYLLERLEPIVIQVGSSRRIASWLPRAFCKCAVLTACVPKQLQVPCGTLFLVA